MASTGSYSDLPPPPPPRDAPAVPAPAADPPPADAPPAARLGPWALAATAVITAINGFIAFVGYDSAKDIHGMAEEARKKQAVVDQVLDASYALYARALEREVTELVAELPGVELSGARSKEIKDAVRQGAATLALLEKQVSADKRLPAGYLVAGFLAIDLGNCQAAIEHLNQYNRETPVRYHLLGVAYSLCKQLAQADAAYQKALRASPLRSSDRLKAKSLSNLGNNEIRRGRYPDALAYYEKALKTDPGTHGVHYNKAAAHVRAGQYEAALEALCEFARRHDEDVAAEVETDPDRDFDALKEHLGREGADWRQVLRRTLQPCR